MTTAIRDAFADARGRVESLHRAGIAPHEIVVSHTADVDAIVVRAFDDGVRGSGVGPAGVALVALGGYGRQELSPGSDLDLLLLYRGIGAADVRSLQRAVMYPLWDSGRELGERIREPRDVVRNLDRTDEMCALLDIRLLAGDRGLYAELEAAVARHFDRGRASFFKELVETSHERHRRYGHAGHLLEPNIRDSAGGLRDIHTLHWAAKLLPGVGTIEGLAASGYLNDRDRDSIAAAWSFLLRLRIELHLMTGRHQDQLYLSEQDELASRLASPSVVPDADRLMQGLYRHAREVDAIAESFWDRVLHQQRRRRWRSSTSEAMGDGCVLQDGRLEVVAVTHPRDDPAGWLRVFRQSVRRGVPVGRTSLSRLATDIGEGGVEWSPEAAEVFLDILQSGAEGVAALEAMDGAGLLASLLTGWRSIRAYPQRDPYHRYTVDRHLLATVDELAASRSSDEREVRDAWSLIGDAQPLFVAGLLHDIGKGRSGDHSEIGAQLAEAAARRLGFDLERTADVTFLVREHLTLAQIALRRDLNDARTVDETAQRVGTVRRLAMLLLLTRADSLATGPEAWSSFRAALVRELYARVRQRLQGEAGDVAGPSQRLGELAEALGTSLVEVAELAGPMPESWFTNLDPSSARRQLELLRSPLGPGEVRTSLHPVPDADEFIVVAADRPGLFSAVAGVLALRSIDVHAAEIYTRADGVAVEVFRVMGTHGAVPQDRWARVRADIEAVIDGALDIDDALGRKAAQSRRRRHPLKHRIATRIAVENDVSDTHTVVEVHTEDRLGLLHVITKALADAGCDLALARVATYGAEVVDVFYVRSLDGKKLDRPEDVRRISEGLTAALKDVPQSR